MQAEVDGEKLTSSEIASFFMLLAIAGNETTRNAISHGVLALTRYPDEREKWWANFDAVRRTAVEEIVRWAIAGGLHAPHASPRTPSWAGSRSAAGDKVSMWYCSANRDETKFADPWTFDVARDPNPHVGFGGGARTSAWARIWRAGRSP